MNTFASLAFGAVALTAASIGFAEPAAARGNVGIYVSPYGLGVSVDGNRDYCRDYSFRYYHPDYCARYDGAYYGDYGYYNSGFRFNDRGRGDRGRNDNHGHDGNRGDNRGHDGGHGHDGNHGGNNHHGH